jgi:hypothetical protein
MNTLLYAHRTSFFEYCLFYLRIQYPVLSYSTNEIVVERKYKNNLTISLDDPNLKSFFYSKNIFKAGDAVKTTKR